MNRWQTDRLMRLRGNGWNKPLTRSKRPPVVYAQDSGNDCATLPPCETYSDAGERKKDWRFTAAYCAMIVMIFAVTAVSVMQLVDTEHPVWAAMVLAFGLCCVIASND